MAEHKVPKLWYKQWWAIVAFVIAGIFLIYLLSSKSSSNNPSTSQLPDSQPSLRSSDAHWIGNFMELSKDNSLEFRFSLYDSSKKYTAGDGAGTLKIISSDGETVYQGNINVKKEDFGTYTLTLTQEDFLAYVWEIPISAINKSSSSSGTAYLSFSTKESQFETLDTSIWGLPTYTQEELKQLNEESFVGVPVNQTKSYGAFQITIQKAGFFTPMVSYGDKKGYFRVDLEVKNIGSEAEYFSPSGMVILDNQGNQYEMEYGGSLDTFSQIYPGVKKSGYILFNKIPSDSQNIKLVFQLGYDSDYKQYTYQYNIPLAK
jgi:hypothetical protein